MFIKLMNSDLSDKIAAGEVVERPVSIIKELVENSLDAKASNIIIEVKDSGIKEIKIIDNGVGMCRDDAILSFKRHATSKIENIEDLNNISTLGFRGEALASISSISNIELYTSYKDEIIGTYIQNIGGDIKKIKTINNMTGTKIIVKNMFYNVPARLKHLKSLKTEYYNILNYLNKLLISRPDIKLKFISDDKIKINYVGNLTLKDVLYDIYGTNIKNKIYEIDSNDEEFYLKGAILHPQIQKSNSKSISLSINNRLIKSVQLNHIILKSYGRLIPKNTYPVVAIDIKVDPQILDINIHPTKQEVKISKQEKLNLLLKNTIENTLVNNNLIYLNDNDFYNDNDFNISKKNDNKNEYFEDEIFKEFTINNDNEEKITNNNSKRLQNKILFYESKNELSSLKIIGQFNSTYILSEYNKNFYIIDQHAAQERIKYDNFLDKDLKNNFFQKLIIPYKMHLLDNEVNILKENKENLLNSIGLDFTIEKNNISIIQLASILDISKIDTYINKIIDILNNKIYLNLNNLLEDELIKLSCRYSIKANDFLLKSEMEELIFQLSKSKCPFTCPHGRPVIIKYSLYQIEKWFKRV